MSESIYRKIGFKEPPFMETGAATNVTPYIPQRILDHLNLTVKTARSGQCVTAILGGAAGSGKTTITKYYFNCQMYKEFRDSVDNCLVVTYTVNDAQELRDVAVFYKHLIEETLRNVGQKDAAVHNDLLKHIGPRLHEMDLRKTIDTKAMLDLFKDFNKLLRKKHFSPIIYVVDEIDYVVDVINEKNYTFIQHLRHIIDLLTEIRFSALVLVSTKLPAAFVRVMLIRALNPLSERISEALEVRYVEDDFLNFVKTRFKEPIIEETNGKFTDRTIRLKERDFLEKEFGEYFPFTRDSLLYLYRKEKGQSPDIERLRIMEQHLAKLVNVYCMEEYARPKGLISGKIFADEDIESFLASEPKEPVSTVSLTPKERQWFYEFFGFQSSDYLGFPHERCVSAIVLSLSKYMEAKLSMPGVFYADMEKVKPHLDETIKGLKFFAHSSSSLVGNLGIAVTILRGKEIDVHGFDCLDEVVRALYSLTPHPQKKFFVFFVEDDFEFPEVAVKLTSTLRREEQKMCTRDDDLRNISVINEKLVIRSPNSFLLVFLKNSSLVDAVSICAKSSKSEIVDIGEQYYESLHDLYEDWVIPYDFAKYTPSMRRLLQLSLLLPAIEKESILNEWQLQGFFDRLKLKGDRFAFNDLVVNGFLREADTGVFQISIPPVLRYVLKSLKHFDVSDILSQFGESIGKGIVEFLTSFLQFEKNDGRLSLEDLDLKQISASAKKRIRQYEQKSDDGIFKEHSHMIKKIGSIDFGKLDKKLGVEVSAGFSLTQRAASSYVEDVELEIESMIRKSEERKTIEQRGRQREGPSEESFDEKELLEFVKRPKDWRQVLRKYRDVSQDTLWDSLRRLSNRKKIRIRVKGAKRAE